MRCSIVREADRHRPRVLDRAPDFAALLKSGQYETLSTALRRSESTGRPVGSSAFLDRIADRQVAAPSNQGTFRNQQMVGASYADFAQGYDPINSYSQGSAGGSYTVNAGDTLQGIAQSLWGDAGLWYKIAEVNGLSAASGLIEGQRLILPTRVVRNSHDAGTMKPYDPAETLGDLVPDTSPKPRKKKCGVLGAVLLAVVAIAVTALLTPAATTALGSSVLGGAAAGAAGSIASQAVGVATGIQDKFSFKGVALAALSAGIAGGLDKAGVLAGGKGITGVLNAAGRGAIASAATQGIATATGLQDKFSWAGVAAAGVAAGVGQALGGKLEPLSGDGLSAKNIANHVAVGTASLIASAATRSAIEGSSFGDNIMAGLPDVIGQAIGRALAGAVAGPGTGAPRPRGDVPVLAAQDSQPLGVPQIELNLDPVAIDGSTVGQITEAVVEASSAAADSQFSNEAQGSEIVVTAPRLGRDVADVATPAGEVGTWIQSLLSIEGTQGDDRRHLLQYFAQSAGGRTWDNNVYAGTEDWQQARGRAIGNSLFGDTPIEWSGSDAAIHLLDEMIALSPDYAPALVAARDTYQALRAGRDAEVNAQLIQDAKDFGTLYAITGATALASGALAAGSAAAGLSGGAAIAVGAGGEAVISAASGSATRAYGGEEVNGTTVVIDGTIGAILGGIGGRLIGGPATAVRSEVAGSSSLWKRAEVNGSLVYQRSNLIDPSAVDSLGRSNSQRMESGLAPIGPDGKSINLHHMLQTHDSPLAEMTQTFHQEYSSTLHINPNTTPSGIDRSAFSSWRRSYWQTRAGDFGK